MAVNNRKYGVGRSLHFECNAIPFLLSGGVVEGNIEKYSIAIPVFFINCINFLSCIGED